MMWLPFPFQSCIYVFPRRLLLGVTELWLQRFFSNCSRMGQKFKLQFVRGCFSIIQNCALYVFLPNNCWVIWPCGASWRCWLLGLGRWCWSLYRQEVTARRRIRREKEEINSLKYNSGRQGTAANCPWSRKYLVLIDICLILWISSASHSIVCHLFNAYLFQLCLLSEK